jgi:hypothetical protein
VTALSFAELAETLAINMELIDESVLLNPTLDSAQYLKLLLKSYTISRCLAASSTFKIRSELASKKSKPTVCWHVKFGALCVITHFASC